MLLLALVDHQVAFLLVLLGVSELPDDERSIGVYRYMRDTSTVMSSNRRKFRSQTSDNMDR